MVTKTWENMCERQPSYALSQIIGSFSRLLGDLRNMRDFSLVRQARRGLNWYLHHKMGPGEILAWLSLGFALAFLSKIVMFWKIMTTPTWF